MKSKNLSELEQELMNIVWECGDCSVRGVLGKLKRKKPLAYTTVATILQRLYEKGLVARTNKDFVIRYSPKQSKEDYSRKMAKSFIARFMSVFGDAAIVSFAQSIETLPKEKKDYFLKLLERHNENK